MAPTLFTVKLFHGRDTPHQTMHDWGFDGPTLGPLESVQLTYGALVLYTVEHERLALPRVDDLIFYDGKLYGDAVVCDAAEEPPTEQVRAECLENVPHADLHPVVPLRAAELREYRACVDVFVDSIMERLDPQAAAAAAHALNRVTCVSLPSLPRASARKKAKPQTRTPPH